MSYNIAVVGATGNVGQEILNILEERKFPIKSIKALSSRQSIGMEVSFGEDEILKCSPLDNFDFKGTDIVFSSAGEKVSKEFAPRASASGAIVIDNSSAYRMDVDVPLIVPEVNEHDLINFKKKRIIGSPNCVAIPLAMALSPLDVAAKIKRVVVSTYQATSGAGRQAMDELFRQTRDIYMNNPVEKEQFSKQIAFNVIPYIGDFLQNGQTGGEEKVATETAKILGRPLFVFATCVRVPTFVGHAIAATIEFEEPLSDTEARQLLKKAPGISVIDQRTDKGFITPVEAAKEDSVFVSRIRKDPTVQHGISLWIVADNLRKGAALNTVQIAEVLVKKYL